MTQTVIYNRNTKYVYATYDTHKGACAAYTRAWNRTAEGKRAKLNGKPVNHQKMLEAAIAPVETFRNEINQLTTVRSLMTGAEVTIRESEVGGPCDPSTERYWSM